VGAPTLFAIILSVYFLLPSGNPLRSVLYLVPILAFGEAFRQGSRISRTRGWAYLFTCLYFLFSALTRGFDEYAAKETVFLLLSILGALIPFSTFRWFPQIMLVAGVINVASLFLAGGSYSVDVSLLDSSSVGETSFGLIMPLVVIYLYTRGRLIESLVALMIGFLMFKRIAIFGAIGVIVCDWVLLRVNRERCDGLWWPIGMTISTIIAIVGLNINYVYVLYSNLLYDVVGRRVTPNEISSGRYVLTEAFWNRVLDENTIVQWIFGGGVGRSSSGLSGIADAIGSDLVLLHNDWIRILSDYGIVGILIVCVTSSALMSRGRLPFLCALYTLICFLTDNTLTYVSFMMALTFVARMTEALPSEGVR